MMYCEYEDCDKESKHDFITEYSAFGHEYISVCDEHYKLLQDERRKPKTGFCEHCNNPEGNNIKPFQDPEEGSSAVYLDTCESCRKSINTSFCDD